MEASGERYSIQRVRNGDREAFAWLVDAHKDMVYALCLRMLGNEMDASEAAQDVFLKGFRSIGGFQEKSRFSTWLFRIAYNHCISVIRKKVRVIDLVDEHPGNEEAEGDLDGIGLLSREERSRYLRKAIEALPDTDAVVVTLFYYQELSLEEVAEITGLSNSNVRIRLHRSRKKLYNELQNLLKSELSSIL